MGNPALGGLGKPQINSLGKGGVAPSNVSMDLAIPLTAFCPEVLAKSHLLTTSCLILGTESCFCVFCSCSDFFWFPSLWLYKLLDNSLGLHILQLEASLILGDVSLQRLEAQFQFLNQRLKSGHSSESVNPSHKTTRACDNTLIHRLCRNEFLQKEGK